MDDPTLRRLLADLAHQDGVVTHRQLIEGGAEPHDVRRWVRARLLSPVHRGVHVDHTGPLTPRQREWVAVLACGAGAAVCLLGAPGPLVHVAIDASRRVVAPPGVRLHRVRGLAKQVRSTSPPRLAPEHDALLAIDLTATEDEVVRILTDAVRTRATTTARLRAATASRSRLRHRRLVLAALDDVERGTQSVLEHRYLRDVERAHQLPAATWQQRRRVGGRTEYADAAYERQQVLVELDGRTTHTGWDAENRDARRDLDQAAAGHVTVRLRHRQVLAEPCATAVRLARLLRSRGWTGAPRPCGPRCDVIAETWSHQAATGLHDEAG